MMVTRELPRKRRKRARVVYDPHPPKDKQERFEAIWAALSRKGKKQ